MIRNGNSAARGAFAFLYVLSNLFANFGPNTTTFIIPGEVFPTRYRSTCHGISAASGKLGAIVAQIIFSTLQHQGSKLSPQLGHVLEIYAAVLLTGLVSTWMLPETRGKTLEELSNEDQDTYIQGVRPSRIPAFFTHESAPSLRESVG